MGLILENIKYKEYLSDITYDFLDGNISGIYGNNSSYIIDIINGDITDYEGNLKYDDNVMDSDYYKLNPATVALIESKPFFYTDLVSDEFRFNLDFRNCDLDILEDKQKELLNLVGLDESILSRNIHTLSSSEKYLLQVAISLVYSPEIIIFKDVFNGLDRNSKKKVMMIIKNLKEDKKNIIVTSNDTNILYELVDEVLLLDGNLIYKSGSSDKIFTSTELMKENVIPMPYITKVTYLAKNKKVKLSYHKDVRDIIKDIYKHV